MSIQPLVVVAAGGAQRVQRVRVTLALEDEMGDESRHRTHTLQLFTERHSHSLLVNNIVLVPGAKPKATDLLLDASAAGRLLVRWFIDSTDADGLLSQQCVAAGCGSSSVELRDIEGRQVGQLHIQGLPSLAAKVQSLDMDVPDEWRKQLAEAHRGAARADTFYEVDVFLDRVRPMPLLWYALSAAQIQAPDPANALALFEHLAALALRFAHPTQTDDASLLADMLALPSLGWVYRADETRNGRPADQWASIFSFPNPERAAMDCEDGSKACLELFLEFRALPLPSSSSSVLLRRLHALAQQYDPFLAVGELKSSDGSARSSGTGGGGCYVLHCFLILLGRDAPHLTVESTAYASGAWKAASVASKEWDRAIHQRCSQATRRWEATARVRSPLSMVHGQRMYGRLFSLFSASVSDRRAQHWLFPTGGVDTGEWLMQRNGLVETARCVIDLPVEEAMQALAPHLALCPRSAFPRAPPSPVVPAPLKAGQIDLLLPRGSNLPLLSGVALEHSTLDV